jgi:hypothetical protein
VVTWSATPELDRFTAVPVAVPKVKFCMVEVPVTESEEMVVVEIVTELDETEK